MGCCLARKRDGTCCMSQEKEDDSEAGSLSQCALFMENKGKRLQDFYTQKQILGKGNMGTVRLAHSKQYDGVTRAIQEVQKQEMRVNLAIYREASILQSLDHSGICSLIETFEDDEHIYIVMEHVEGQSLLERIVESLDCSVFDEPGFAAIMEKVFGTLQYLHEREVLHCDMKPENIMVCQPSPSFHGPTIKIIDVGMAVLKSAHSGHYSASRCQGTPDYMAPEARDERLFSPASDMWSVGVIMFVIFMGRLPECRERVQQEALEVCSIHAQDLLQCLLQNDPKRRMMAADAIRHPWIRESNRAVGDSQQRQHSLQKAGRSFVEFYQSDILHKAALTAVASQITGEQIDVLREHFCLADKDGNGIVTRDELIEAFGATSRDHVEMIDILFEDLDSDGSGGIEFTEWAAASLKSLTEVSDASLLGAFRTLDGDDTGSISLENLSRL